MNIEKHNHPANFGKHVEGCSRCHQLKNGARPIKWASTLRREAEEQFIREIKAHDCKKSGCGFICTFGDW